MKVIKSMKAATSLGKGTWDSWPGPLKTITSVMKAKATAKVSGAVGAGKFQKAIQKATLNAKTKVMEAKAEQAKAKEKAKAADAKERANAKALAAKEKARAKLEEAKTRSKALALEAREKRKADAIAAKQAVDNAKSAAKVARLEAKQQRPGHKPSRKELQAEQQRHSAEAAALDAKLEAQLEEAASLAARRKALRDAREAALAEQHELEALQKEAEEAAAAMGADTMRMYLETGAIRHSVNFPNVSVSERQGYARLAIVHKNEPGILGQITTFLGSQKINITQQANGSRGAIAYTLIDIEDAPEDPAGLQKKCADSCPAIISLRYLSKLQANDLGQPGTFFFVRWAGK